MSLNWVRLWANIAPEQRSKMDYFINSLICMEMKMCTQLGRIGVTWWTMRCQMWDRPISFLGPWTGSDAPFKHFGCANGEALFGARNFIGRRILATALCLFSVFLDFRRFFRFSLHIHHDVRIETDVQLEIQFVRFVLAASRAVDQIIDHYRWVGRLAGRALRGHYLPRWRFRAGTRFLRWRLWAVDAVIIVPWTPFLRRCFTRFRRYIFGIFLWFIRCFWNVRGTFTFFLFICSGCGRWLWIEIEIAAVCLSERLQSSLELFSIVLVVWLLVEFQFGHQFHEGQNRCRARGFIETFADMPIDVLH